MRFRFPRILGWLLTPQITPTTEELAVRIKGPWKITMRVHPVWPWWAEMQYGHPLWELAQSRNGEAAYYASGSTERDLVQNILLQAKALGEKLIGGGR